MGSESAVSNKTDAAAPVQPPLRAATAPATTVPRQQQPSKPSLLSGSISIKVTLPEQPAASTLQAEVRPLTQEDLERYWDTIAAELNLTELLGAAKPIVGDHTGIVEIEAQTVWFADEFRNHRTEVMEHLRKLTGQPMLECKVKPKFVEGDEVVYSPDDKYAKMIERNPALASLRKLMPELDY